MADDNEYKVLSQEEFLDVYLRYADNIVGMAQSGINLAKCSEKMNNYSNYFSYEIMKEILIKKKELEDLCKQFKEALKFLTKENAKQHYVSCENLIEKITLINEFIYEKCNDISNYMRNYALFN